MGAFREESGIRKLAFCISFLMIVPVAEIATASISYPLSLQDPVAPGFLDGGPGNSSYGWRFRVNESGLSVGQLGVNSAISSQVSHTVTLFDFETQTVLAQVTTTPTPGWGFEHLGVPVPLEKGRDYVASVYFGDTGGYYYGYRDSIPDAWFPAGAIEYLDMRYADNTGASDFPDLVLTDAQYGIPDIGYYFMDVVPTPGATVLAGAGMAIVSWLRRRRTL